MSIYFNKVKSILELTRTVNGKTEESPKSDNEENDYSSDLDDDNPNKDSEENSDNNKETNQEDSPKSDNDKNNNSDNDENKSQDIDLNIPDDANNDEKGSEGNSNEENDYSDNLDDNNSNDYSDNLDDNNSNEDSDNLDDNNSNDYSDNLDDNNSNDYSDDETGTKKIQDDLFKDLSKEQLDIKLKELKQQYLEIYTVVSNIILRSVKITKTNQNIRIVEFCINKLEELKKLIFCYMTNTFDTKTYIENSINYQQYLATLNSIDKLFKEIQVKGE